MKIIVLLIANRIEIRGIMTMIIQRKREREKERAKLLY